MPVVIAADQGTTNTKAVAFDPTGRVLASAGAATSVRFPRPGWVEQDPDEIWRATLGVVTRCVSEVGAGQILGLAITNQRESVVAWDPRSGGAVGPVLSWQDSRTAEACVALQRAGASDLVRERTGLPLDAMFSATKMSWLLRDVPAGTRIGTVDSWLVWNLTGGREHVIEAGNASRTLLMDLDTLTWDDELLDLFSVPGGALPQIRSSDASFGTTDCEGLPKGIPLLAVLADSHAALAGHGGGGPAIVKATYGTGSSVMQGTGAGLRRRPGLATTLAWSTSTPTYALEGNIRFSGACLDWMARLLDRRDAAGLGQLAATVPDSGGASVVPAFGGLGAPHWVPDVSGLITGLSAGTSPAHLARAAFDSVAMQVADVVEAMADGLPVGMSLRADGGASASTLLMQGQADALGIPVVAADQPDVAMRGVAAMAYATQGYDMPPATDGREYSPLGTPAARQAARHRWSSAVRQVRSGATEASASPANATPHRVVEDDVVGSTTNRRALS